MRQNNMVAMILAGGRGSRLYELTKKVAKPAVFFGGKYRIIDFPLSNCANSGIEIVGVLTQYESVFLNFYVAKDQYWGLDARDSGVFVLPPRETDENGFEKYRGTADAITQNLDFLDKMDAEYVLVLSGDHIYKMDYSDMLNHHIAKGADCTIAVLGVPMKEASRFGIMNTDEDDMIIEFEEKPKKPKSNLASMGIYIFNYKTLKKYLNNDDSDLNSSHDFGHDIIPTYIKENKRLAAYRFRGYWKDVGTIDSLWEGNMDLLDEESGLDLSDPSWKIYTSDTNSLPQYIGRDAKISNSYINQGSLVNGQVDHSVIFSDTIIEKGAKVIDSVIMPGAKIESKAVVTRCIVGENVTISEGVIIGSKNSEHIELVSTSITKEGK